MVSISLDQQLVRTLIGLRDDGVRLALLYVIGASFAGAAAGAAAPLLPFLPPRDTAGAARGGAASPRSALSGAPAEAAGAELPTEARALLLSLASAGIPCLTLGRGGQPRSEPLPVARRPAPGRFPMRSAGL